MLTRAPGHAVIVTSSKVAIPALEKPFASQATVSPVTAVGADSNTISPSKVATRWP